MTADLPAAERATEVKLKTLLKGSSKNHSILFTAPNYNNRDLKALYIVPKDPTKIQVQVE